MMIKINQSSSFFSLTKIHLIYCISCVQFLDVIKDIIIVQMLYTCIV